METLRILRHSKHSNSVLNHFRRKSDLISSKENFVNVVQGFNSGANKPSLTRSSSNKSKVIKVNENLKIGLNKLSLNINKEVTARNRNCEDYSNGIRKTSARIIISCSIENLKNQGIIGNKISMRNAPELRGYNANRFYRKMNASKEKLENFYKKNT
jgi:hypothetical protein